MVETVNNLLQPQAREDGCGWSSRGRNQAAWPPPSAGHRRAGRLGISRQPAEDVVQENTENIQLEVARMSTDGNLPDLKFPQTGGQGNAIHLSANTLKQHGRN
ncbi:hypothetical protein cypCar_00040532, partial [Cyprinus carpio]